MKKAHCYQLIAVFAAVFLLPNLAFAKYSGGTGTEADPYLIGTPEDLNSIGLDTSDWDKHFKMIADVNMIDITGDSYNIIGNSTDEFTGVFDGNNRVIANFTYDSWDESQIGLFSVTEGEIRNVTLSNIYVHDFWANQVAGLAAQNIGTIENCHVQGNIVGWRNTGAIVGYNRGNVINCSADCHIRCRFSTGGLVGQNGGSGVVLTCYAGGDIGGDYDIGGLVGTNTGQVRYCFASAGVVGESDVGGLAGGNSGVIDCCYSTGEVSGDSGVGGLIGENYGGKIFYSYCTGHVSSAGLHGGLVADGQGVVISSYWDIETCGVETSSGGIGKTTEEMKTAETYVAWGCGECWKIDDGNDYPRLTWENSLGELIIYLPYLTGSGTESAPYLVNTAEQLNQIGLHKCDWDKHFLLISDIDLSDFGGDSFNIIGAPFTGIFDGNGYTISNFTYSSDSIGTHYIGLFGHVDGPNAEIKHLCLKDPNVDVATSDTVGSLAGQLGEGSITDCNSIGGNISGNRGVGGLVGFCNGTISHCYTTVSVSGNNDVGGLIGNCDGANIYNCYSSASVSGGSDTGGLCGRIGFANISNCYSSCTVTGDYTIGGLVGSKYRSEIHKCYSTSNVSGTEYVGGLVGYDNIGLYASSFWNSDVNPGLDGIGNTTDPNVIGKTTTEMKQRVTFTDWDFVGESVNGTDNYWRMCVDGIDYPKLAWQSITADLACGDGVNFVDFAFFAGRWLEIDCDTANNCGGADLDFSTDIDLPDFQIFMENWLRE